MKNKTQNFTEEEKNEFPVTASDLLAEIFPVLGDYFVGQISMDDNGITYSLPNGQKFILTAKEV